MKPVSEAPQSWHGCTARLQKCFGPHASIAESELVCWDILRRIYAGPASSCEVSSARCLGSHSACPRLGGRMQRAYGSLQR
jgi:hypothetical protein